MKSKPYWKITCNPDPTDYKCDLCGAQADAVHFFFDYAKPEEDADAIFGCAEHDPGGRWFYLRDLLKPRENGEHHMVDHIAGKTWGLSALAALEDRIDDIRRELAVRGAAG